MTIPTDISQTGQNERNQAAMPNESPNTQNKNPARDTYWFAHGGVENIPSTNAQSTTKSPNVSDLKDAQLQKDKEERLRIFREQQEEERLKKLKDLEQQFLQAKKLREQQEEERKRRIEEARIKETERRQQVEERKRQIWEAEQERKEAILRRNMEREARIEARRNAQRMAQSFAFGSSTPRTFDLDLAAIGRNTSPGLALMSSVSGRRSEDRELGPPRATSACSLDRKFGEDCMSRSMVSLSSSSAFRGRKRTDIMPTLTRERSITPHVTPRGNHCMRAVSMTRLDQLAQPRRPYRDSRNLYASPTTTNGGPRAISPSMTKSMCNLANTSSVMRKSHVSMSNYRKGNMSQSMMHLADTPQKDNTQMTPSPPVPKSGMRSAQSMMHLAAPPPRLTRAARLRAQALASSRASSAWNLSKPDTMVSGQYLSPGKDTSRSPSRPQSSMSGASEISATSSSISAVNMRTRSAPRRPRPFSIAGSIVDRASSASVVKKEPESHRQPRLQEKNAQSSINKPVRAKSVGREKTDDEMPKPLSAPKKPVPPPKSKEVLARAKSHPVPTKDNLRKNVRPNVTNTAKANIEKQHEDKGKLMFNDRTNDQNKVIKSSVESKSENAFEIVNSSPITSPVTDSEMCISSEDSRNVTESDINTHTQTFTESEGKTDQYESVSISKERNIECQQEESSEKDIPNKSEQKEDMSVNISDLPTAPSQASETELTVVIPQRPRITSEEEARAALAEKRRLAREQAEREAELERQRQEDLRRQEEERQRIEEEKQREMELEAIRLAELHRQLEEEKLRKAIEEQKQREKEEQEKKQEEARLKAEKEEQERKTREEAEKQRLELEERLRKEEEERAERKKRVEQIMARTRGKSAQTPPATTPVDTTNKIVKIEDSNQNSSENVKTNVISPAQESAKANYFVNGSETNKLENNFHSASIANNYISSANSYQLNDEKMSSSDPLPDLLNTNNIANCSVKSNGHHLENDEQFSSNISVTNSFNHTSSRTLSAMEITSPTQTNGYSSHEDMSCTTSPEESSDAGLLVNIGSSQQNDAKTTIQSADFTKLVDIESSSLNMSNENFLINVDSVNSNILSSEKSYPGFDECLQKKSDATVADLLS